MDTSTNNKRIAKNTLFLYFRSVLLILISLYTSRVVLESLGVSDFGTYTVVGGMVTMFSMLSGSMSSASQRFITFAMGKNDFRYLKKVVNTSVSLHIFISIIVFFMLEIAGVWFLYNKLNIPSERLDIAFWVLQFSILTFLVGIITVPFNSIIVAHERMSAFAYIGIIDGILKLAIAIFLTYSPIDRLLFYAGMLFVESLLVVFFYLFYCIRNFNESRGIKLVIERGLFREMFSFAGWNLIGSGSLVLRNQGIDIVLNLFFGVTVNAAKGVCNQIQHGIYVFVTNFQTAVNPQLTKSVAQGDFSRTHTLIMQGGRFSFYLLSFLSLPIIIEAPKILSLWLVEVPPYTIDFVRWTMIYLLWDTLSRFLIHSILAYGKIKRYEIVVACTKLLALPLAYVWLLMGGSAMVGIWVNIIIEIVCLCQRMGFNVMYNGLSWKKYMFEVVLRSWFVFALSLFICLFVKEYIPANWIVNVVMSFLITSMIIAFLGMSASERAFVYNKAKSFINRKFR